MTTTAPVAEPVTTTAPVAVPALLVDDTTFHDYTNYLTAIFRPGDTLCFVGIEHNKDKGKEQQAA